MSETITLYLTSKFDAENVPISETVLNEYSRITTVELVDLNDSDSPSRSVRFNYRQLTGALIYLTKKELNQIKYVKSGNGIFYEATGYRFFSAEIIELNLQIAPFLNDWLGSNENPPGWKISGMIERESHKDGDPINLLSEPFSPVTEQKTIVLDDGYPGIGTDTTDLVLSTIALHDEHAIQSNKKILTNYSSDDKLTSYEIQPAEVKSADSTIFYINSPFATLTPHSWRYSGLGVFKDISSTILNNLNALGITDAITERWSIPTAYITTTETSGYYGSRISRLEGKNLAVLPLNITTSIGNVQYNGADYTIKNEKAKYYSLILNILARVSGEKKSFRWADITNPTNINTATLGAIVDPSPDGAPYCYSTFYKGSQQYNLWSLTSIRGGTWNKPSIVYQGKTGRLLSDFQTSEQITNNTLNLATGAFNSVISGIASLISGNVGGAVSSVSGMITDVAQTENDITQLKNAKNLSNALYSPNYTPADLSSLAGAIDNNFAVYTTRWGDEDIVNFDNFLTKYGWAQNKFFEGNGLATELNGRGDDFAYIRFADVTVTGNRGTSGTDAIAINNYLKQITTERLLNGVRFWRS